MIKNKLWPDTKTTDERGKLAEQSFFYAWDDKKYKLPNWIVSVAKATKHEDSKQKTDAIIICIKGPNIKIQIKSYIISREFKNELIKYGVVPIVISSFDTVGSIRRKTYSAIKEAESFLKKEESKPRRIKEKVKKKRWRKRRA